MTRINKNMVFEAADVISQQGDTPTVKSIREHLKKGSYSTIIKYFEQWKEQGMQSTPFATTQATIPDAFKQLAISSLDQIWSLASTLASDSLNTDRLAFEREKETAGLKLNDAITVNTK